MAKVYLALQTSLERLVALKVMHPQLMIEESFQTRFLNEGQIVAQLSHPNIVTVFDIGVFQHYYYLSMELLPGGTLRDKIREGLSLERTLTIATQLGYALEYAHRRGYVHRDIKPLNVLFRADGSPVLTDFGIAKALAQTIPVTLTGYTLGSVGYMSPEQYLGQPIDTRSDLYSLGVLLWEMLTGKKPYVAEDAFATAMQHATSPIPMLPPELAGFQPIINRLLAKRPEDRYASAEQSVTALQNIGPAPAPPAETLQTRADDATVLLPAAKRPVSENHHSPAAGKRRRWPTVALAVGITLMVMAALLYLPPGLLPGPFQLITDSPQQPSRAVRTQPEPAQPRPPVNQPVTPAVQQDAPRRHTEAASRPEERPQPTADRSQAENPDRQVATEPASATLQQPATADPTELAQLLARAQAQWQAGRWLAPPGDNAFESYSKIRKLAPNNDEAKTRLLEIGRMRLGMHYQQKAEALLREGSPQQSLAEIRQGLRLAPKHAGLLALQDKVREQLSALADNDHDNREDPIADLLEQAQRQWQAGHVTEPSGDNAYESYREVLTLDPRNPKALEGLLRIGRTRLSLRYRQAAERLVQQGALEASLKKIDEGLRLTPDATELLELRAKVQAQLNDTQQ